MPLLDRLPRRLRALPLGRLLQAGVEGQPPVMVYLSNGPWNLVGPVPRFLERNGFPADAAVSPDGTPVLAGRRRRRPAAVAA